MRGKFTSMKAIERRHLKQNDFVASVKRATDYFKANRDQITVTALIVAIVGLGAGGYYFWKQRTNDHAAEMLAWGWTSPAPRLRRRPPYPGPPKRLAPIRPRAPNSRRPSRRFRRSRPPIPRPTRAS